jgi:alpha-galactosidase
MYYAFFAPDWDGELELRGLDSRSWRIMDYENGTDLGSVKGPAGRIRAGFKRRLLVEAKPQ